MFIEDMKSTRCAIRRCGAPLASAGGIGRWLLISLPSLRRFEAIYNIEDGFCQVGRDMVLLMTGMASLLQPAGREGSAAPQPPKGNCWSMHSVILVRSPRSSEPEGLSDRRGEALRSGEAPAVRRPCRFRAIVQKSATRWQDGIALRSLCFSFSP